MAYRLIIEENTIYEIDEDCERMLRMNGTNDSANKTAGNVRKCEVEPEASWKKEKNDTEKQKKER